MIEHVAQVRDLLQAGDESVEVAPVGEVPDDVLAAFAGRLRRAGASTAPRPDADRARTLTVTGLDAAAVGRIAADGGVTLAALTTLRPSLEDVFLALTRGSVEYVAGGAPAAERAGAGAR